MLFVLATFVVSMIETFLGAVVWLRHRQQRETPYFVGLLAVMVLFSINKLLRQGASSLWMMRLISHFLNPLLVFVMLWLFLMFFAAVFRPDWWERKAYVLKLWSGFSLLCCGLLIVDGLAGTQLFFSGIKTVYGTYAGTQLGQWPWLFPACALSCTMPILYIALRAMGQEGSKRKALFAMVLALCGAGSVLGVLRSFMPQLSSGVIGLMMQLIIVGSLAFLVFKDKVMETTALATQKALEGMEMGMGVLNAERELIFQNPALKRQFHSYRGAHFAGFVRERFPEARTWLMFGEGPVSTRLSSAELQLAVTTQPLEDVGQGLRGHLLLSRDITLDRQREAQLKEREEAELLLKQEKALIEIASRAKSQFLAHMSHELRTPLNAIIGYAELVQEELEDLEQDGLVEDLDKIRNAGKHLLSLINDVLDLSKIEAGKMELHLEVIQLHHDVLKPVFDTLLPAFEANQNQLVAELPEGDVELVTDKRKLTQILLNLLSNANKFTQAGEISCRALAVEREGVAWLELQIQDTGIGMTQEQVERVFQPFIQADEDTSGRFGGTGLGLSITQRFCELMGGSIAMESAPDEGTTVRVLLPTQVEDPSD